MRSLSPPNKHSGNVMIQTPLPNSVSETSQQLANNIKRRTDHGSLLLQSPARLGYHDRMRQIFENANHTVPISPHKEKVTYPQLLSTPRRTFPLQKYRKGNEVSYSSKPSFHPRGRAILGIENLHREPTEHTVDSWTDDSGYLHTEPHVRLPDAGYSTHRILQWLSNVALKPLADVEQDLDIDTVSDHARPSSLQAYMDSPPSSLEFSSPASSQYGSRCSIQIKPPPYQARVACPENKLSYALLIVDSSTVHLSSQAVS